MALQDRRSRCQPIEHRETAHTVTRSPLIGGGHWSRAGSERGLPVLRFRARRARPEASHSSSAGGVSDSRPVAQGLG